MYSNRPAASIVVTDLVREQGLSQLEGKRKLNEAGLRAVDAVAQQITEQVDSLLGKGWSRREGAFTQAESSGTAPQEEVVATCACGSGIPIQTVSVNGQEMTLVALPLIFQNFRDAKKAPSEGVLAEVMEMVKIYNGIEPADELAIRQTVAEAYLTFWKKDEVGNG
jgi:hypothetical protein